MSQKPSPLRHILLFSIGLLAASTHGLAAVPTITSFTPGASKLNTPITITGTNFVAPVKVAFAGVNAASITLNSSTRITVYVPLAAPSGKITVTAAGGTATSVSVFTVVPGLTGSAGFAAPTGTPTLFFSGFSAYEAVDLYFDTVDFALTNVSGAGAGSLVVTIPATATPGTHWLTVVGRHSGYAAQLPFLVRTDWPTFGFRASHIGYDSYENTISTSNVGNLQEAWRSPGFAAANCTPTVVAGTVYAGFGNGTVHAFDEGTGAQKWVATLGDTILSSPTIDSGTVYIGADDGKLYALNAATGAVKWTYTTGDIVRSSPAVSGGIVYFGSFDDYVYALNSTTGAFLWKYATGDAVFSSPAVANGLVYIGSNDASVYCLNAATGVLVWSRATSAGVAASPLVVNGLVLIGSDDKTFYAYNASNGGFVWSYATGGPIQATAAYANGTVFFSSDDDKTYALAAATGAVHWSATPGTRGLDQAVAVANGVVYVGDAVNTYALAASYGGTLAILPAGTSFGGASVVNGGFNVSDYYAGTIVHYTLNADPMASVAARPDATTLQRRELR